MSKTSSRPIFNVQKHQASHLHYNFRLEIDGVLKSWAIPKGPSMDPAVKRLAVQVEDHDIEYAEFEGVIDEGRYGAGPVLVWDTGWFETLSSPKTGKTVASILTAGKLDFILHGQRLKGGFSLVQMKGKPKQWLLVKHPDAEARPRVEVTEKWQTSVLSKRTIQDLEQAAELPTRINDQSKRSLFE